MNELSPAVSLVALGLALFAVVALALSALRQRHFVREQSRRLETMQSDLRALCNAAVQVGERVNLLEQGMKQLQQRQQELGIRQDQMVHAEPEERTYEQAVKLAQKGTPLEEIMDICNLSRGEAELITMMHRLDRGS
jgi:hypothetical protein